MSDSSLAAEVAAEAQQLFADSAILYALATLMAYEYLLTVHREASTIWPKRRRSGPAWLFLANRYLLMLSTVLSVAPIPDANSCRGTIRLGQAVNVGQYIVIAVFSALRVYAIWDRNLACALSVLALGLVPVATNLYVFCLSTLLFIVDPVLGNICSANITVSPELFFRLLMTTRASVISMDTVVLIVTWWKTWHTYRAAARANVGLTLSYLILRDGTIYFFALLAMNILEIFVVGVSLFEKLEPVSNFITTLTPILISRFILNLRTADYGGRHASSSLSSDHQEFSTPRFRAPTVAGDVMDNMGELVGASGEAWFGREAEVDRACGTGLRMAEEEEGVRGAVNEECVRSQDKDEDTDRGDGEQECGCYEVPMKMLVGACTERLGSEVDIREEMRPEGV